MSLSAASGSARAGDRVSLTARVAAHGGTVPGARVTAVSASPSSAEVSGACASGCELGDLGGAASSTLTVSVPVNITGQVSVTVTLTADASAAASAAGPVSDSATVVFRSRMITLPPRKTPPGKPGRPKGPGGTTYPGSPVVLPTITPPDRRPQAPLTSTAGQVALPPAVAPQALPGAASGPVVIASGLRAGNSPQPMRWELLTGAHTGWMGVLLAGFLIVTVRLHSGRRRPRPAGAARRAGGRGVHRRRVMQARKAIARASARGASRAR